MITMTNQNGWGFPIQTCERCKGSGHYSFNPVDGTRCYGCTGRGTKVTKNAQEAWSQFQFALHAHRNPAVQNVATGDVLRLFMKDRTTRKATVVSVIKAAEQVDGVAQYELTLRVGTSVITYTMREGETVRKIGNIDPAPFLAMITKEAQ